MSKVMYLLSIVLFCGSGLAVLILVMTKREKRMLKRYEWLLLLIVVLGIPIAAAEYFALKWGAWAYNSGRVFDIRFPTEIETYAFVGFVSLVVAVAALVSASRIDAARNKQKHRLK